MLKGKSAYPIWDNTMKQSLTKGEEMTFLGMEGKQFKFKGVTRSYITILMDKKDFEWTNPIYVKELKYHEFNGLYPTCWLRKGMKFYHVEEHIKSRVDGVAFMGISLEEIEKEIRKAGHTNDMYKIMCIADKYILKDGFYLAMKRPQKEGK